MIYHFDFKMKGGKVYLPQEGKKEKKKNFDMRPPGIEPGLIDSKSDVLSTLLLKTLSNAGSN